MFRVVSNTLDILFSKDKDKNTTLQCSGYNNGNWTITMKEELQQQILCSKHGSYWERLNGVSCTLEFAIFTEIWHFVAVIDVSGYNNVHLHHPISAWRQLPSSSLNTSLSFPECWHCRVSHHTATLYMHEHCCNPSDLSQTLHHNKASCIFVMITNSPPVNFSVLE